MNKELQRLKEVEARLLTVKNTYENILPIWNAVDRKRRDLDLEIHRLVEERNTLVQGQLVFNEEF